MSSDKNDQPPDLSGLVEENRILQARLNMSKAFMGLYVKGYLALRSYDIDYMDLKEYKAMARIDQALLANIVDGQVLVMDYIAATEQALEAAVRRKSMRLV